jgi:hypothetical protein
LLMHGQFWEKTLLDTRPPASKPNKGHVSTSVRIQLCQCINIDWPQPSSALALVVLLLLCTLLMLPRLLLISSVAGLKDGLTLSTLLFRPRDQRSQNKVSRQKHLARPSQRWNIAGRASSQVHHLPRHLRYPILPPARLSWRWQAPT